MIPVVELLRVSTDHQAAEERAGIPGQHSVNLQTCTRFDLEIVESVEMVESGADVATSAGMGRVLECVTSGRARGILLAEYSRLFRPDRWSDFIVLQTLSDHDARIFLPSGEIDLQSEVGFVQATVNNLLAAMERRRIRERMDRGKEEHRRRGAHVAGGVGIPFGMSYSKEAGWEWTEDAAIVRELFRRFLAGERTYDVLGRSLGLPRTTTKYLLQNPVYTGWRIYDEQRDPGAKGAGGKRERRIPRRPADVIRVRLPLEPLVSEEDFALVQELIASKAASVVRRPLNDSFLYRGFLECAYDGLTIYGIHASPKKLQYVCRSRSPHRKPAGVEKCPTGYMMRDKLERELDQVITERLTDPDLLASAAGEYLDSVHAGWRSSGLAPDDVDEKVAAVQRRRERILESYFDGVIGKAERDARLAPVAEELRSLEQLRATAAAPRQDPEALTQQLVLGVLAAFAEWRHLERRRRRAILEALAPRFYLRKYEITGVRLPLAAIAGGGHTASHWRTADRVTARAGIRFTNQGGLYVPLCA